MIISHLGPSWGLLGAYRGPERARLSSEQPYFGKVGENDLWARRRPQRLQVTLKHFTGAIKLCFRRVIAAFAKDQETFFSSTLIQRLKIQFVLTPGPGIERHLCNGGSTGSVITIDRTLISVTCSPQVANNLIADFFLRFQNVSDIAGNNSCLQFQVKARATAWWQTKFSFFLTTLSWVI